MALIYFISLCLYLGWTGTALAFVTTYLVLIGDASRVYGIDSQGKIIGNGNQCEKMPTWYESLEKPSMQVYI